MLLFDEADAIAARRSTSLDHGFLRESNTVVNVLLQELETFNGVVIFATNLAANFDPAFERRIRTHVLFEMPGVDEREQIWRVQMHPRLTPLASDVNFRLLAETYEASGGDIRNAVLKAAMAAASEPGRDASKQIHQRHLEEGITEVLAAKHVMRQSLFQADVTTIDQATDPRDRRAASKRMAAARDWHDRAGALDYRAGRDVCEMTFAGRRARSYWRGEIAGRSSASTVRPIRATISGNASTSARAVWKFTMQARST